MTENPKRRAYAAANRARKTGATCRKAYCKLKRWGDRQLCRKHSLMQRAASAKQREKVYRVVATATLPADKKRRGSLSAT